MFVDTGRLTAVEQTPQKTRPAAQDINERVIEKRMLNWSEAGENYLPKTFDYYVIFTGLQQRLLFIIFQDQD